MNPFAGLATDSLYKFMALAGLVSLLLITWYAFNKEIEIKLHLVEHETTTATKLGMEVATMEDGEAKNRKLIEAQALLKADHDKHQILAESFNRILEWAWKGQVLALALAVTGFWLWYYKVQQYQDLMLKNQAEATIPKEPDPEPTGPEPEDPELTDPEPRKDVG